LYALSIFTPESAMSAHQTRQRKAIYQTISQAPGPLRPNEILELASADVPRLGIATVYRTINLLLEAGEIQAVPIDANDVRYEPTDRGHHHHFLCRMCNTVYDMEGCAGHMAKMLPYGFEMDEHEILIRGTCSTCKSKA
jgi:Fur family ferric uptake transcriptional regulator